MFNSGDAAAQAAEGKLVGVDVDQSTQSDAVITSAMKDLAKSVIDAITKFYDGGKVYGGSLLLGAKDNAVGIPTDTWQFENYTIEEYQELYDKVVSGEVKVDNDSKMADPSEAGLKNVKFVK